MFESCIVDCSSLDIPLITLIFLFDFLTFGEIPHEIMIYPNMCNIISAVSIVSDFFPVYSRFWSNVDVTDTLDPI